LPQNWHEKEHANFHISSSDFPVRGAGVPGRKSTLEALQIASGFKILEADLERGVMVGVEEEASRYALKHLLTRNKRPKFLGGIKVKI
jgi:hypothetical protein